MYCKILKRQNKFLVKISVRGKNTYAYLHNTGRLEDFIFRGARCICIPYKGKKSSYRLLASLENGGAILDTNLQERIIERYLRKKYSEVKRTVRLRNSIIDFLADGMYIEIKSAAMKVDKCAGYPDCRSKRAHQQIVNLIEHVQKGGKAQIAFLCYRRACIKITDIDSKLKELLKQAKTAGVQLRGFKLVGELTEKNLVNGNFKVLRARLEKL